MPDARVELWRDPRYMRDVLTYGFTYSREQFHEMERDLVMSSRGTMNSELSHLIYQRLGEIGLRGATMAAWMDMGAGLAREYGLGLNMSNPQHMVGLGLLIAAEFHRPTFVNLMDLDRGVEVRMECGYNNLEYTVNLFAHVSVPHHLAYRGGRDLTLGQAPIDANRYTMGGSQVSLVQDTIDLDMDGGGVSRRLPRGPQRAEVSLNGVDVGSFTDLTVAANITGGQEVVLRDPAMVVAAREDRAAQAVSAGLHEMASGLVRESTKQKAAAVAAPQGDLAPRKMKRVSVATEAPTDEAESTRRLKVRRGRKN